MKEELKRIIKSKYFSLTEHPIELSGGGFSRVYFNLRDMLCDPNELQLTCDCMDDVIDELLVNPMGEQAVEQGVDVLCTPLFGAAPMTAMLSVHNGCRAAYVRKEAKKHGAGGRFIGEVREGDRVIMLDDVCTSEKSIKDAEHLVVKAGGSIVGRAVILDRRRTVGTRLRISSLFHIDDFTDER